MKNKQLIETPLTCFDYAFEESGEEHGKVDIDSFIEQLQSVKRDGYDRVFVSMDSSVEVIGQRFETDAELKKRLDRDEANKKYAAEYEYNQYLKLKEKFEGKQS